MNKIDLQIKNEKQKWDVSKTDIFAARLILQSSGLNLNEY